MNYKKNISAEEIKKELEGYEIVKDYKILRKCDRIKYIRKDTGKFVKGGIVIHGDIKKGYIVLEGFGIDKITKKPIRFSVTLKDVILFHQKNN